MDLNIQLFTGSCTMAADLDTRVIISKLNRILEKTKITNAIIGWNNDADLSAIIPLLKQNGANVYLWLPVFSELHALADFLPLFASDNREVKTNYNIGNGEKFLFCCPANTKNSDKFIEVFEKHYDKGVYDGVFLDKIRYPSFFGGTGSVLTCFCDYCRSKYDLPEIGDLYPHENENPLGISSYNELRYNLKPSCKKLFDYKCDAVFHSLERLCVYFRGKGLKIGLDLFAPFMAYFVGQDYYRLIQLADFVKPMFYNITNAPAGIPFEINMYANAFDNDAQNAEKRKEQFLSYIGYGNSFINNEIAGIRKIIVDNGLKTMLYAGIEINYDEDIAPVTEDYIRESVKAAGGADGIVASWDLNTMPDSHIDSLLAVYELSGHTVVL
jgi:hypothetical protein